MTRLWKFPFFRRKKDLLVLTCIVISWKSSRHEGEAHRHWSSVRTDDGVERRNVSNLIRTSCLTFVSLLDFYESFLCWLASSFCSFFACVCSVSSRKRCHQRKPRKRTQSTDKKRSCICCWTLLIHQPELFLCIAFFVAISFVFLHHHHCHQPAFSCFCLYVECFLVCDCMEHSTPLLHISLLPQYFVHKHILFCFWLSLSSACLFHHFLHLTDQQLVCSD